MAVAVSADEVGLLPAGGGPIEGLDLEGFGELEEALVIVEEGAPEDLEAEDAVMALVVDLGEGGLVATEAEATEMRSSRPLSVFCHIGVYCLSAFTSLSTTVTWSDRSRCASTACKSS